MPDLLFVGDVQGCAQELRDLLATAGFDPGRHRLAFCGDLINRGPDSVGVLELARRMDALAVIGNHEVALLEGRPSPTLDQVRRQLGSSLEQWIGWLRSLPTFIRGDGYILVHAGIVPGKQPEECTREELTELRTVNGEPWFHFWRPSLLQGPRHRVRLRGTAHRPLVAPPRVGLGACPAPLVSARGILRSVSGRALSSRSHV